MSDQMTIADLVARSYETAASHGFWDTPETAETIPTKLALIMSEAAEALESYRDPKSDSMVPVPEALIWRLLDTPIGMLHDYATTLEELETIHDKWLKKPKGFHIEIADVFIRLADLCGKQGIDIETAIRTKQAYNETRPYRHGRKV